ncbi:MAG: inositol monophosphatase family protein [Pseudomonadota bacterium]
MADLDIKIAQHLAGLAGAAILPHFRALTAVDSKGEAGFDPVTVADRAAEAAIREHLSKAAPDDGVIGEEFPRKPSANGRHWIVDPIDGTRGFIMGLPTWGTLIALHTGEQVTTGLMAQPFVGETFFAGEDGAFHQHLGSNAPTVVPLKTRPCATLSDAILTTTSPELFHGGAREGFERVCHSAKTMRYGADCYGYAMVAAGHCDGVVELGLSAYDIAPFIPLIRGAGGVLTDFQGNDIEPTILDGYNGEAVAVGDAHLLDSILKALNG